MSKSEKLLKRFLSAPNDFTWQELMTLLKSFGYHPVHGKGSRMRFVREHYPPITLHRPHPSEIMKRYQLEQVRETLKREGLL